MTRPDDLKQALEDLDGENSLLVYFANHKETIRALLERALTESGDTAQAAGDDPKAIQAIKNMMFSIEFNSPNLGRHGSAYNIGKRYLESKEVSIDPLIKSHPHAGQMGGVELEKALHYPECWDVAAYPTVYAALNEVTAFFRCSNEECSASCHITPAQPDTRKDDGGGHGGLIGAGA